MNDLKERWDNQAEKDLTLEGAFVGVVDGIQGNLIFRPIKSRAHTALPNTVQYPFIISFKRNELATGYLYMDGEIVRMDVRVSNTGRKSDPDAAEISKIAEELTDQDVIRHVLRLAMARILEG